MSVKVHQKKLRNGFILFLIWLVPTLYNLGKPYHLDDTAHLEIAYHGLQDKKG